jgi:DNA-directed RNA polymerase subunit RPC12/RpoP
MSRHLSAICADCKRRFLAGPVLPLDYVPEVHPARIAQLKCPHCGHEFSKLVCDLEVCDSTTDLFRKED